MHTLIHILKLLTLHKRHNKNIWFDQLRCNKPMIITFTFYLCFTYLMTDDNRREAYLLSLLLCCDSLLMKLMLYLLLILLMILLHKLRVHHKRRSRSHASSWLIGCCSTRPVMRHTVRCCRCCWRREVWSGHVITGSVRELREEHVWSHCRHQRRCTRLHHSTWRML